MKRQCVYLSVDTDMATFVGKRRNSNSIILQIESKSASDDGIIFYIGNDKVWLCEKIPPKYIKTFFM